VLKVCEIGGTCSLHVGKPYIYKNISLKRPLEGPRRRWKGNVKIDVEEIRC
jgi:hypothetical protein